MRPTAPLGLAVLALVAACDSRRIDPSELDRVVVSDQVAQRQLDILFVIENSSTANQQAGLVTAFPALLDGLRTVEGGLPDLHVGLTSTDLGAGGFGITGCIGDGDGGRLLNQPVNASCDAPIDGWLDDREDPDCTETDPELCRIQNFAGGSLAASFACIGYIGTIGCGFEQPLEAMRLALDGNPGFLRDDAFLAVVLVGFEDDCSASDPQLFDPNPALEPMLGPLSSYRCFEHGVRCDPDEPSQVGPRFGCRPREDSRYLRPVSAYVDYLRNLKTDPSHVIVAAITGPVEPVEVVLDPSNNPSLRRNCENDVQLAVPGIRVADLITQLGGQVNESCNETQDDVDAQLTQAGVAMIDELSSVLDGACLDGYVFDSDHGRRGIQADCEVVEGATLDAIPSCEDDPEARPCFDIRPSEGCSATSTSLAVFIQRDEPPPPGTVVRASCVVRRDDEPSRSFYDCSAGGGGAAAWLIGLAALLLTCGRGRRATARTASSRSRRGPTDSARPRDRAAGRSDR